MAMSWASMSQRFPELGMRVAAVSQAVQVLRLEGQVGGFDLVERRGFNRIAERLPSHENILGVGVIVTDAGEFVPAVFADTGDEPWRHVDEMLMSLQLAGADLISEARVATISLPRAVGFAGPGERCQGPKSWGTFGARVTDAMGNRALLTAGHVGGSVGSVVFDDRGNQVGTVQSCLDPAQCNALTASPDVAVVTLDAGVSDTGSGHATTSGTVLPRSDIDIDIDGAKTGLSQTWINGIATSWAGPDPQTGDWGYVLVTKDGVTDGGDSGAPAFLNGTNQLVGHVVGGKPGVYSLIQELDYQIGSIQTAQAAIGLQGVQLR